MVNYVNENHYGHILTIEDPIEFAHKHKKSVVDQREVGLDTKSYGRALRSAMRAAPDVIQIGEIRDRESMQSAIDMPRPEAPRPGSHRSLQARSVLSPDRLRPLRLGRW